jgi:hypothetical protein
VLLAFADVPTAALGAPPRRRGVPLAVHRIAEREIAGLYGRKLVLVRPDGHVAWRGDRPPQDAPALIDTVRGAPSRGLQLPGEW